MTNSHEYRLKEVTPPGVTLKEKIQEMGLTVEVFANTCGISADTVTAILQNSASITTDIATALERATKIPVHFWLNRQRIYDETRRN